MAIKGVKDLPLALTLSLTSLSNQSRQYIQLGLKRIILVVKKPLLIFFGVKAFSEATL
jgi:hypothetical protein